MNRESLLKLDESLTLGLPAREDVVVSKARGTRVWDISGKRYTDLFAGIAVANVGHAHPDVVRAIRRQAGMYMHVSNYYHNDVAPFLAEKLVGLAPGKLSRCFFSNSGAEAIEGAVKIAKKRATANGNSGAVVVAFQGSFHGRLALSLTLTGQHKYKARLGNFANYPGVVHLPPPYYYRYGGGLSESEFGRRSAEMVAEALDNYVPGDVAALIIEPVFGEGGIIVPPDNFLPALQRICKERSITFVVDEVQTGIGRTGKMFASEHWGLAPDMIALAKGVGGGLPLAAILASDDVAKAMEPGDHFSTFGGNPVCCAAGIAALDVVRKERLVQNSSNRGKQLMKILGQTKEAHPQVGDVRGKGLMVGVELVHDAKKRPAQKEAAAIKSEMLKLGYLIGVGGIHRNVLRIQPPLVITSDEIDGAVDALEKSISLVFR
ncbi:MAG: aspartate aminotransferase family protein [Thaumarchaeota archaeon]|nr:aspartate aminotransferase family protein [Nitrososphaerota archaeon]